MPLQGTDEQRAAGALSNAALAQRLDMIKYKRRSFSKDETDAFLEEAAIRLRWPDAYMRKDTL